MPRYFFHIHDGRSIRDPEGTGLPDIYVAQAEAVRLSGALLRDLGAKFWDEKDWKLEVTDELDQTLFILTFSVEERTTLINTAPDTALR
jgi:hypothetical protein